MPALIDQLRQRASWSAPAYWALLGIVLATLLWLAAKILWLLLGFNTPLPEPLPYTAIADSASPPPTLAAWHLFGSQASASDPRSPAANAPQSQLQLSLVLVWAGRDPRRGLAILRDAEGSERHYRVGEEVSPGVRLDQVLSDRVLLSRNGTIEALPLVREGQDQIKGLTRGQPQSGKRPQFSSGAGVVTTSGALISTANMGQVGAPQLPMAGIDLDKVRAELGADPVALAQQITPLPVMENGKLVGVRLHAGANQMLLSRLGLQPDDIVTAVNGVTVTDPSRIAGVVAGLGKSGKLSVEVRRNGKTETLAVNLH